ncbi:helix-turn-helix domain-containing protein [Leuconostoc fallax]|uniref:PucR family transcriptional regulator n=1 Tax=Leuconostoc fallax TaxID=1251 RepID=UPI0002F7C6BC|nr:helix-turn-helix domain-containing protein [Leuconostoc fallax]
MLDIKKLVNEATEALTLSIHSNKAKLTKFRPKQVSDLLQLLPEKETTTFIDNILKPILDIKNKDEREQLLQTIAYYFTENRSILSVSKILFVHRNTTMYRLKKIEKLLGFQLDDFNESEQLQLAIRLYMLNKPKI